MFLPFAVKRGQCKSMKKIRSLSVLLLAFSLVLCMFAVTATPVYAAETDMDDYLAKALGVTQSDRNNYSSNYKNSIPIDYEKGVNSAYLAIGGKTTSASLVIPHYSTGYPDQVAGKLGFTYGTNYSCIYKTDLTASGAVAYINDRDTVSKIPGADLITFQIDASSFIASSTQGVMDGTPAPWGNYIKNNDALVTELNGFRSKMTQEYAGSYGQKNAESIATVLEYMLYESIVYSHESIKAVQAIRAKNANAVILLLGLYNPMKGLKFTANGSTIDVSGMLDDMIRITNAYLLKQTKNMSKVAFVDISATSTNGYSTVALDINNGDQVKAQLNDIMKAETKQHANQAGHDHIRSQILDAAKAPCKHPNKKVVNAKTADCKEAGYTGDTVCADCGASISKGSTINKKAHSYGSWTETKTPGCTTEGEQTRICSVCSTPEKKTVAAAGHKWDKGEVTEKPTCTATGKKLLTCTVCKTTKDETVPTANHNWDGGEVTAQPTCDAEGTKTFTCQDCSTTKTEPVAQLTHIWDEGVKGADGTVYTCTLCSATHTVAPDETLPPPETEPTVTEPAGTEPTVTEPSPTEPKDSNDSGSGSYWWIILAVAVVAGGGIAAFLIIKKKKN